MSEIFYDNLEFMSLTEILAEYKLNALEINDETYEIVVSNIDFVSNQMRYLQLKKLIAEEKNMKLIIKKKGCTIYDIKNALEKAIPAVKPAFVVTVWQKYGKNRIYINRGKGSSLYIEITNNTAVIVNYFKPYTMNVMKLSENDIITIVNELLQEDN